MIYLDGSYIIKCYLDEPGTSEVLALVHSHHGRSSSVHGRTEFWSGLHRHLQERHISIKQAQAVWQQFGRDEQAGLWHWLPITRTVVKLACDAFEKLDRVVFLRSSDALHLACAAENGFFVIYSGDRILLAAAAHFGLDGVSVY
ncbi:MAG: type II toxin-antitoxin system VapC family toxin [Verrucomicrobiota bacterium]|nr:type II toxin-antitoxin system VapC family toxin [Verrucomicrobiota bacterium]